MGPFLSYFPFAATMTVSVLLITTPPSLFILATALVVQIIALLMIIASR